MSIRNFALNSIAKATKAANLSIKAVRKNAPIVASWTKDTTISTAKATKAFAKDAKDAAKQGWNEGA